MQKSVFAFLVSLILFVVGIHAQNPFGTGNDGALTVTSGDSLVVNTIASYITADAGSGSLSIEVADASSFSQGDEVLIITMIDPEPDSALNTAGQYESKFILQIAGNNLYFTEALDHSYDVTGGSVSQVLKIPNYTDVTINGYVSSGAWNGQTGGVLAFRANGTVTVSTTGKIDMSEKGYRGRDRQADNNHGLQGEGIFGLGVQSTANYGNAGGGGNHPYGGGGGGGNAFAGNDGSGSSTPGTGGLAVGDSIMSKIYMGGSGGTGGDNDSNSATNPNSGSGGGIIFVSGMTFNNYGLVLANGGNGQAAGGGNDGGAGGGAGGSIYLHFYSFSNDSMVTALGGAGYANSYPGGNGSVGRIFLQNFQSINYLSINPTPYEESFYGIFHTPLMSGSNTASAFPITAYIIDQQGNAITDAKIYYRVNNGSYSNVSLSAAGGIGFTGSIPAQAANSVIDYYFTASDGSDNYTLPATAPAAYFSFDLSGLAPSNFTLSDDHAGTIALTWQAPGDLSNFVAYNIYRSQIPGFTPSAANLLATTGNLYYDDISANDFYTYYYRVGADYGFSVESTEILSLLVNNYNITTVLGYAFKEGQTNHANIKIKFNPVSPSAVLDSTYTNALGYFETTVNPGIYTITYEATGYQTYTRESDLSIIDDHDFGESTILQAGTISNGNVSGTWNGIYSINGDITVPNGDTLIIEAGSTIRFWGNYNIYVYGYLEINGNPGDSVLITSAPDNQIKAAGQWQGIDFYDNSDDNSLIKYCRIEYAVDGIYFENSQQSVENTLICNCSDKGFQLNGSTANPIITNCEVFFCYDGIYSYYGRPTIDALNSHNNSRYGLYWDYYSYGTISNSHFDNNSSNGMYLYNRSSPGIYNTSSNNNNSWGIRLEYYSQPYIEDCTMDGNSGYGISFNYNGNGWTTFHVINCTITNNSSWGMFCRYYMTSASDIRGNTIENNGGGIYLYYYIYAQFRDNRIIGNNNHGIYLDENYCNANIHHNIIAYNTGDGINRDNHTGYCTFAYNTIYGNSGDGIQNDITGGANHFTNNIVANNNDYGIRNNMAFSTFEYNNVYSNASGEVISTANLPVNAWNFVSYNAQGDSADIYLNISEDPLFSFTTDSADFTLTGASPCINTGDPGNLDPDHTASDIGALYYDFAYPHQVFIDGTGDQQVSISWDSITIDSLISYKVYYKLHSAGAYTYSSGTGGLSATISGLTNDSLYDFAVTGIYNQFESGYSLPAMATPGIAGLTFNPSAFNLNITVDTLDQNLNITNNGSKELNVKFFNGMPEGAAHFDGNNDYYYVSDPPQLESMTALTVECWIKRQADGHFEFISKHYRQFSLYIDASNYLGFYKGYTNDYYESYTSSYQLPENEWHHVAIVWEGEEIWYYADGQLVDYRIDAQPQAIPNLTYQFRIGCRGSENNYFLTGELSEARIWNVARTSEEIYLNYRSSLEGNEAGLVGYWPLHSDYSDHSPSGLNLTSYGNVYISGSSVSGAFEDLPLLMPDGPDYSVPVSGTVVIPYRFPNTGQTGTYLYTQHLLTNIEGSEEMSYEMALTYGTNVPSTPVHYSPISGNDYTIIITYAEIDGTTIDVGDEIAAFDGNTCVGAGIFDGTFNFVFTVSDSIGSVTNGNAIEFKIYDASADLEAVVVATYEVGDGTFGYGEFTACSLSGTVFFIQEVPVTANMFNLISFNKLPKYSSASTVFSDLADLQIAYNDAGAAYIPPYSINSIGDIYFKDGYHVFCTSADTIFYVGTRINPYNWPILVSASHWNSIAYLGETQMTVSNAFDPAIVDSIDIVQTFDGSAWIPSLGINTIAQMNPGYGYQVALSSQSDINIVYQTDNSSTAKSFVNPKIPQAEPEHFIVEATGLPYQIVIDLPESFSKRYPDGCEIAAFDGEKLVGSVVYNNMKRIMLTAWESNPDLKLLGFTAGNPMQFKIYDPWQGETAFELVSADNIPLNFKAGNFSHLKYTGESLWPEMNAYPNPFNTNCRVQVYLPDKQNISLRITDISGKTIRILANGLYDEGIHQFIWDTPKDSHLENGVYFIELHAEDFSKTIKLIKL